MILFQTQIEEHRKLADHYRELAAKREALVAGLLSIQQQADTNLSSLKDLVDKCKEASPIAIASLKSAVLTLFDDGDDGSDGGNQPHSPTPEPDDSEPELLGLNGETGDYLTSDDLTDAGIEADTSTPVTYAQAIKNRCGACWGYEVKSKADIKAGFINRTNLNFMEAVNLERTGKEFYQTVEAYLDRLYYNGQTCEWASPFASPLSQDKAKYPQTLSAGSRYWFGSPSNTGTVIKALGNDEYLCQIDGAVGEVELFRSSLHYIPTFLEGQACDIDYSPHTGQHCQWASPFASPLACAVEFPDPEPEKPVYIEFVEVSVSVGYLKVQHSGEIKAAYAGFTQKQRAESWGKWLTVRHEVASGFEVRLAKHLPFKWELKLWGLSLNQINCLAKEDLTSSPHTEVDSAKPPSYKKPQSAKPVNPDDIAPGDIVTPLLTPGDSYEVIQVMPNGILDCKSLRTGVNMGMRPGAVSLLVAAEKVEDSPTAPSTEIQFNDLVEVVADANDTVGLVGTFGRVKTIKGSRIGVEIDEQLTYFDSKELKVKARAEAAPQPTGLQSGRLLMGGRITTTGNYTGLARRSSILNTRIGTADKVAALELMKGGLSPELAMAVATGTADTDYDF